MCKSENGVGTALTKTILVSVNGEIFININGQYFMYGTSFTLR